MQIIREVNTQKDTRWRRIYGHIICSIIQKLGTTVALYIVAIVVSPTELNVQPVHNTMRKTMLFFSRFENKKLRSKQQHYLNRKASHEKQRQKAYQNLVVVVPSIVLASLSDKRDGAVTGHL